MSVAMLNSTVVPRVGFHGAITATIDWCEMNYQFNYYIAEMANTFSNLFTIGFAVYGGILSTKESLPARFILGFMGIGLIGLGSFWFHATLLFQAQLADELPMIYVTSTALWLLFDNETGFTLRSTRTRLLTLAAVVFNMLFTWSYYIYRNPVYHQVVFGTLLFSIVGRIYYLLNRSPRGKRVPEDKRRTISKLFSLGVAQFTFAFILWNLDNIYCDTLTEWKVSLGWPLAFLLEGHSWWHVASGTYFKFIGIQYLALCLKDDHRNFTVEYKMGLPYVRRLDKRTQ
ncbi:ceramidase [Mycena maculata]|uniref:Ceramidase n=1 Tax=Mycena maculata TaxID=230809 RepID=A0AAD7J4G7_9AGAR|nr:ceramidase [Mycena maculata]